MQNKYYVIPTINVDGLAFIEEHYRKEGVLLRKRKNMNVHTDRCPKRKRGVDLNRNFATFFGKGDTSTNECK